MADEIPEETKASQEVGKEAVQTAKKVGKGVLDIARLLLAGRKGKGAGREPGREDGMDQEVILLRSTGLMPGRVIVMGRDPFEHLRIAQRQAARDLEKFYREAKRRADRGAPMDEREFAKREASIVGRMGPGREETSKRMREDAFSEGPVRSAKAPVRPADGRVRTPSPAMGRSAMAAMGGLSKGPAAPAPLPSAALARGLGGGMGR
jgi:hypothetical protein